MLREWMIYGANGYTGQLTAELAVARGMKPVLAGRNAKAIELLAGRLGLSHRVIDLRDARQLREGLEDITAVLHCAGPFSATAAPMVDACLATRTHYLDITGEIDVFEAIHGRNDEARAAGISLLPGVGFDVVPTDCLAASLARRLPEATHLDLAFCGLGSSSAGTMKSAIEGLPKGGRARIGGQIERVPALWRTREVPFADKVRMAATIPWGDVSTAFYSTKIPNIAVYMALPPGMYKWLRRSEKAAPLLGLRPVQTLLKKVVDWRVKGPDADARGAGRSEVWGEVRDDAGQSVTGTLTAPEGYTFTADSSLRAVERVLEGSVPGGALTPSMAFGADFVRGLDGVIFHE